MVRYSLGTLCEIANWNSSTSIYAVAVFLVAIAGVARVACDDGLGAHPLLLLRLLNDDSCSSRASMNVWSQKLKEKSPRLAPHA